MATSWTAGPGDFIRPFRLPRVEHYKEGASQTFKRGYPVILSATSDKGNKITVAGADPTADIVGFAADNASGTEDTLIPVWVADEQAEFQGRVQDTGVLDADDTGEAYGLVADATNLIWRVDRSETTTTIAKIVKLLDGHGDTNGKVVFKVLNSRRSPFAS